MANSQLQFWWEDHEQSAWEVDQLGSGPAQVAVDEVKAGDICALTGLQNVAIGDTICSREFPAPLPSITVEEPTVRMTFLVNTSPFAGREGKFVTS